MKLKSYTIIYIANGVGHQARLLAHDEKHATQILDDESHFLRIADRWIVREAKEVQHFSISLEAALYGAETMEREGMGATKVYGIKTINGSTPCDLLMEEITFAQALSFYLYEMIIINRLRNADGEVIKEYFFPWSLTTKDE